MTLARRVIVQRYSRSQTARDLIARLSWRERRVPLTLAYIAGVPCTYTQFAAMSIGNSSRQICFSRNKLRQSAHASAAAAVLNK